MDTIPREPIDAEPLDLWREHRGEDLRSVGRETLAGVLEEIGVELGVHDARIAAWAGDWELSTVATIASWLVRAYDAGQRAAAPDQPRPRVDVDADQPEPDQPEPYRVTLDLTEHDAYFVLTTALEEWAHDQRGQAENELADDPEDTTAASRLTWAAIADELLERVEADQPRTSPPDQPAAAVDEPDQPAPDQPATELTPGGWTAGQLRTALAELPASTPLAVNVPDRSGDMVEEYIVTGAGYGTVDWGDGTGPKRDVIFGIGCKILTAQDLLLLRVPSDQPAAAVDEPDQPAVRRPRRDQRASALAQRMLRTSPSDQPAAAVDECPEPGCVEARGYDCGDDCSQRTTPDQPATTELTDRIPDYPCDGCICCTYNECGSIQPPGWDPCRHDLCPCWAG